MNLHERYMHTSTVDFTMFELLETALKDNPFSLLHRSIKHYNNEITKNNLCAKKLKTLQTVLCYEYQLTFNSKEKHIRLVSNDLCFKTIENILVLKKHSQNFVEHSILYDIIILQLTLYCNFQCIEKHLINFQKSNIDILSNNESNRFYIKILECFLESLQLKHMLHNNMESNMLKNFSLLYLKDIMSWLEIKENKEWQLFATLFPKLISTFNSENILPVIWDFILNKLDDLKDSLSALSIVINVCFPFSVKNDVIYVHSKLCYTEQLWLIIIKSLKSSIQQYRKQGLFIMKHVTGFMNTINENLLTLKKPAIVPFVCSNKNETKILIKDIKQKFFLILDALEEKQHHLILPALTHLSVLIKGNEEHASCCDCFNTVWLQLIFDRILQHDNNNIVKQGVLHVCNLYNTSINDSQFLKLFIHVLNNTFLYECHGYQNEPEILNNIITLFIHAIERETEFTKKLLKIMNEETWAPIPIFYVLKILRTVSSKILIQWKDDELILVKSLVQKNLNIHSHVLRIASQIELLKILCFCIEKINNVKTVMETLLEFSLKETLLRESFAWDIVVNWLKRVLVEVNIVDFIKFTCDEYLNQSTHLKLSPEKFAVVVVMFHDTGLILQHKTCVVIEILNNWMSILNEINIRPYADHTYIFYILEFMSHLFHLDIIKTSKTIKQLLSLYFNDALQFLLKNSKSIPYKLNYEEISKCLAIINSFLNNGSLILSEKEILNYVEKFRNESIIIIQNIDLYTNMHYMYALSILYNTQEILFRNHTLLYVEPLFLDISDIHISDNDQDQRNTRGKIISNCHLLLARLMNQFLAKVEMQSWPQKINWFINSSYLYDRGGNEIIPEIALILKTIVNRDAIKNDQDKLNLTTIFTTCWNTTLSSKKNKLYFIAMENLVGVIINNNFLKLTDAMHFVNNFLDQLLEEGNNVPKLKQILLKEMKSLNVCYLNNFQEALLLCCLHGYVVRKDKQIENQAYIYIRQNYRSCYPQHISIIDYNNDVSVRSLSIVLLHRIITADVGYASTFLIIVLQELEKYKNKRYFNHSYIHKIKHRIMQILLILQPLLNKLDIITLEERICSLMLLESNQHSVKLMQEWLLIKIFVENTEFHHKLWEFFEEGIATRPGCVSAIACVVYHVSKLLPNESQYNFIVMGIKYVAHCCLGQQYNMRLYSQIIFVKLYKILEKFNCEATLKYKGLYDAAITSLKDGNLMKNSNRIQDDFYLSFFHPIYDFSLQTIYFELPRLTDMDINEWITPDLFETLGFKETINHPLQLYNLNTLLSDIETSSYLMKSTVDKEYMKNSIMDIEELNNIQKKIDPSMSKNLSQNDIFSTIRESVSHKRLSDDEGLIVVACLVSRAPNLGGLARTCEIFNVKELVIANLNQIKDKEFQNLSVSAENWITITEVKPHQLCKFLLDRKETGWSLIGLEQTVNSTNLLNMKFKKKTILVLGNEKNGIPANLIPLFDTCVEIPQTGIIRSLNVHVSGAICIWQYAKQHVLI